MAKHEVLITVDDGAPERGPEAPPPSFPANSAQGEAVPWKFIVPVVLLFAGVATGVIPTFCALPGTFGLAVSMVGLAAAAYLHSVRGQYVWPFAAWAVITYVTMGLWGVGPLFNLSICG